MKQALEYQVSMLRNIGDAILYGGVSGLLFMFLILPKLSVGSGLTGKLAALYHSLSLSFAAEVLITTLPLVMMVLKILLAFTSYKLLKIQREIDQAAI